VSPRRRQRPSIAQSDLISLGKIAESRFGLTVGENPWFGGVDPVHVPDSYHYKGLAFDASGPADKMLAFDHFVARNYGPIVAELFHEPGVNLKNGAHTSPIGGHSDHVHVALDPSLLQGKQSHFFSGRRRTAAASTADSSGDGGFDPLGTAGDVAGDVVDAVGGAAGSVADDVISGVFDAIHPEALMLNVALVGGGAFLVYYGAALMLGIRKPVGTPAKMAAMAP
jgi:hypothetical protein